MSRTVTSVARPGAGQGELPGVRVGERLHLVHDRVRNDLAVRHGNDARIQHGLQRPRRGFARIKLVITHKQFRLAAVQPAGIVEFGQSNLCRPYLVLCFGTVRSG